MYAVEFKANIKDGTIDVPKEFRHRLTGQVRVLLMVEEETAVTHFIDDLLANPLEIGDFQPIRREEIHART